MDETWTDLSVDKESNEQQGKKISVSQYLQQVAGLSVDDAKLIIQNLGATSMEDLGYVDHRMAEEATSSLKLIPKKKAMMALLEAAKSNSQDEKTIEPGNLKSNPIDKRAKKSKKCETDAFVQESIAICIDHSGSMGARFDEQQAWCDDGNIEALQKTLDRRSRMDAVKQVFYAFRDRTETLDSVRHELGLIKFDEKIDTILSPTSCLDKFEKIVDNIEQRGMTAIYSAILEACKMLQPTFQKSPKTDLRILVLSDGQNNHGVSAETALKETRKIGAVVDAIIVGDTPDENLRKIVAATDGSCFQIRKLSEGFEMMESEAVVSLRSRRGGCEKPVIATPKIDNWKLSDIQAKEIVCGSSASKVVRMHKPLVPSKIVDLCSVVTASEKSPGKFQGNTNKRLMKELRQNMRENTNRPKGIQMFIDDDNLTVMKALIDGPIGTPFEDGVFALDIRVPPDYPFRPPKITFENPIYHCNVSDIGEICLDVLMSNWNPSLSVLEAIEAVQAMLSLPNSDNALRQWIAEITIAHFRSGGKDTRYVDCAKAATRKDASRSVEDWKKHWGVGA